MGIITTYPDDSITTDSDKFLTSDSSGATKLTTAATLKSYMLPTNGVTAPMLATSAITLGYAQITSNFTTSSLSQVQVTGLTVTCTIPSGGRRIKITLYSPFTNNSSTGVPVNLYIWDGPVNTGTQIQQSTTSYPNNVTCIGTLSGLSAGSKTFNIGMSCNGGTAALTAGTNYPAFILVEAQ